MKYLSIIAAAVLFTLPAAAQQKGQHTDGEVLQALKTINDGEIAAANNAQSNATSQDVKDFATHMIGDHTAANQKIDQLVAAQNIALKESALSLKFKAVLDKDQAALLLKKGPGYDKSYIGQQVKGHKAVLAMLDKESRGRSDALNPFFVDAKKMVSTHLRDAKALQAKLKLQSGSASLPASQQP